MHLKPLDHSLKTERIKQFKGKEELEYIYQNKLDKAYFQHDIYPWDFKDLPRRTVLDKV